MPLRAIGFIFAVVLCNGYVFSQVADKSAPDRVLSAASRAPAVQTAKLKARLLGTLVVCRELGLSERQVESLPELLGTLKSLGKDSIAHDKLRGFLDAHQYERLVQLEYQVEIAYLGLKGALLDGQLGKEIGVNRSPELQSKLEKIESDLAVSIEKLTEEMYERVFSNLSTEQKNNAKQTLGRPFDFESSDLQNYKEVTGENGQKLPVPDYKSVSGMLSLLTVPCVAKELNASKEQVAACRKLRQERMMAMVSARRERQPLGVDSQTINPDLLDEVLHPEQAARLKQLLNHIEIAYFGLEEAFLNGDWGREIGIYDNQKTFLAQKIRRSVELRAQQIYELNQAAQNQAFGLLGKESEAKAKKIAGNYFSYKDSELVSHRARLFSESLR